MHEFIGKKCKLKIKNGSEIYFYTAKDVTKVSDTHIYIIDKYDVKRCLLMSNILEIVELLEDTKNE